MARIIVATYMVRYPLGGMLSWSLQWIVGLQRLGHDLYVVEKSNYPNACYDPTTQETSDDGTHGFQIVHNLLKPFDLHNRLAYLSYQQQHHGLTKRALREAFDTADVLIDLGNHGAWNEEAEAASLTKVLVDGEPGFTQIKMEQRQAVGEALPEYDHYFSNGANIGTPASSAPTAGKTWHHVFNPVIPDLFPVVNPPSNAAFTTVMNWQSHAPIEYQGHTYGQKDLEFARFMTLPQKVTAPMEVAVSGAAVPWNDLHQNSWRTQEAQQATITMASYREYLQASLGEFSVCKNVFVTLNTGWFSDRSAAYLASGRPVVLQDTGFSQHLPTGEGLFAVKDVDEAAEAIDTITKSYPRHSKAARNLALEFLSPLYIRSNLLENIGL